MEKAKQKRAKYLDSYPHDLYIFFRSFSEAGDVPSFLKFAESRGLTLADIERFRSDSRFEAAYRECEAIRLDRLIDGALTRRFDPSFAKFLIGYEFGERLSSSEDIAIKFEVEDQ